GRHHPHAAGPPRNCAARQSRPTPPREHVPRLVAWELTNRCNLRCRHCRAADAGEAVEGELTPEEALHLVDEIAEFAPLTLILSGGEPLVREDFLDIVRAGIKKELRVAVATNGVLLDEAMARTLKDEGVSRVSLSLDGADAATHDGLRGLEGAYDQLMAAAARLREAGLPFQINTTVTTNNVDQVERIAEIVPGLGAVEHHVFMFVPTGRGEAMALGAERYEAVLELLARRQADSPIRIQVTCAPHYQRVIRQTGVLARGESGHRRGGTGCLGGTAFVFVSSTGEVYPCGYLPIRVGDVRKTPFAEIWRTAPLFCDFRDRSRLEGRCGVCEYRKVCGGCRARAYAVSGNVMGEEPYCTHVPAKHKQG
ncbi:MAG: radical SAM protein, partial [Planctomycetota bacterium]